MNNKVAIVTDSVACLPPDLVSRYHLRIIPINIILNDRVYRDSVDLTASEFYRLLRKTRRLPTTSPASPGVYANVYKEIGASAGAILCITVSSRLSALNDAATMAAQAAKKAVPHLQIKVIDSETAAGAEGFVVLAAARAAAQGKPLAEVLAAARSMIPKVNLIAMLDTLYYLVKGGRVPRAAAWATSLLQIKPVFELAAGEATPLMRGRTKRKALDSLLTIMKRRLGGKPAHINVMHADALEDATTLKERILAEIDCVELLVTEFTPVMGSHTGPGLIGLAFYADD